MGADPSALRRYCITRWMRRGVSVAETQERLGARSVSFLVHLGPIPRHRPAQAASATRPKANGKPTLGRPPSGPIRERNTKLVELVVSGRSIGQATIALRRMGYKITRENAKKVVQREKRS